MGSTETVEEFPSVTQLHRLYAMLVGIVVIGGGLLTFWWFNT